MSSDDKMKEDDVSGNGYDIIAVNGVDNSNSNSPLRKSPKTVHSNSGLAHENFLSPTSSQTIVPADVIDTTPRVFAKNLYTAVVSTNESTSNPNSDSYLTSLVEGFNVEFTDKHLNSMVDFILVNMGSYDEYVRVEFNSFMRKYDKSNPDYSAAYSYLFESLKRKINRRIRERIRNDHLKRIKNKEIEFEDVLRRFNSETILFSIAETKPNYEEIRDALGINAYSVEGVKPKKLKESIQEQTEDTLKYLSDKYTAGSGIDGSHDAETVKILRLLKDLNSSNEDLHKIIREMTCMSQISFNPKKAINDLEKLIADVESKFRHLLIPFIEETTEYVPLELYDQNPNIRLLTRPDINTIQESGRSFGNSLFEISTACFDAGTRKILQDQWIRDKLYKIENVYGVNYMFIADAEYYTNHVFACIDDDKNNVSYWNYYLIRGEVSLNDVLDIFHMNNVTVFEHARRGNCIEGKGASLQANNIFKQYEERGGSVVLKKKESDQLWNEFENGSQEVDVSRITTYLEKNKTTSTNLFKYNPNLAILLFFSLKGVGDASVESFYQEEVIEKTIQTLVQSQLVFNPANRKQPFTRADQIVSISTLNTVDSFLERLIRLAYLCGKIDYSPPRIRPVAGGGIVTLGGASMSKEQIEIIENKNNLLKYVLNNLPEKQVRMDYLMKQFGLDKLKIFIDSGATTSDSTMKTIILPVLGELYSDRENKLNNWLHHVGSSAYDTTVPELKVNLDNLLSLSGDIGSILNEYDEYIGDILKIPSNHLYENVVFSEEVPIIPALSPEKLEQGSSSRRYIKVIVNKEEDSFILELPNNNYNERIITIIESYKKQTNSEAYVADDVLGLAKINGKSCLKFKSSIELFINMYRRFKAVQVQDLCSSARSEALDFFTNIIVERLQKYSTKDKESLKGTVRDALLLADTVLEGTSGGGKNMTRKKRLTKKRLKRKRITKKKNKTLRPIKLTKKRNKKSKKHKTYKKM